GGSAVRPPLSSWSSTLPGTGRAGRENSGLRRLCLGQNLDEADARAADAGARLDLELVGDGADDGDSEAALGQLRGLVTALGVGIEPLAVVEDLDRKPVGKELVADVDMAAAAAAVRVANRVRARLRERELQIRESLLVERPQAREAREGEPAERDVLRFRRNAQADDSPAPAVLQGARVAQGLGCAHVRPIYRKVPAAKPADFS